MSEELNIQDPNTAREIIKALGQKNQNFEQALMDSAGEITESIERIADDIEELSEKGEEKIANTYAYIEHIDQLRYALQGAIDAYEERIAGLKAKLRKVDSSRDYLKSNIQSLMYHLDLEKIRINGNLLWIQEHESVDISELNDDDKRELITAGFGEIRENLYIDKRKIGEEMDSANDHLPAPKIRKKTTQTLRGI